jgi:hypothetical protein
MASMALRGPPPTAPGPLGGPGRGPWAFATYILVHRPITSDVVG